MGSLSLEPSVLAMHKTVFLVKYLTATENEHCDRGHPLCLTHKKQISFPATPPERRYASFTRRSQIKSGVNHENWIIVCFTTKRAIKTKHQSVGLWWCNEDVVLFWFLGSCLCAFPSFNFKMGMECVYACARLWRDCVSVRDVVQWGQILMRVACGLCVERLACEHGVCLC